jgi:hypothetical protein
MNTATLQHIAGLLMLRTPRRWNLVATSREERPTAWSEHIRHAPQAWRELTIGALTPEAVRVVAEATNMNPTLVADTYQAAEGHPLRWRELLWRAARSGAKPSEATLTALLAHEIAVFGDVIVRVALAILFLDDVATWELLGAMLDMRPAELEGLVRPLRERGVIEPPMGKSAIRLVVADNRWREAILHCLPPAERRDLHRRCADALADARLLADRADIQLRIVGHLRAAGALEAATAKIANAAGMAARAGQASAAHALWTRVLEDVYEALGDIPLHDRQEWAAYALRQSLTVAPLPLSPRADGTQGLGGIDSAP